MAMIPVIQNLHEEFAMLISIVDDAQTIDQLCETVSRISIAFDRNGHPDRVLRVRRHGDDTPFPRDVTVAQAGIGPMTSLVFYYEPVPEVAA